MLTFPRRTSLLKRKAKRLKSLSSLSLSGPVMRLGFPGHSKASFPVRVFPRSPSGPALAGHAFYFLLGHLFLFSQPRTVVTFDFLWFSSIFHSFSRSLPRPVAFRTSSRFRSPRLPHSITSFSRSLTPREYLLFLSQSLWFASQRFLDSSPIVFPFLFSRVLSYFPIS